MHGCGNDYIYVNCMEEMIDNPEEAAVRVSDRHFGIGSDGLILICPSEVADFRMAMYNADGSEGKMCGNGIRCIGKLARDLGYVSGESCTVETLAGVKRLFFFFGGDGNGIRCIAKYVYEYGLTDKDKISVETKSGIKYLDLTIENGKVVLVKVDMGAPVLCPEQIPVKIGKDSCIDQTLSVAGRDYQVTCVSMGNPHAVTFVEDTRGLDLEKIGPGFEHHEAFPDRINTEFVQVLNQKEVNMRVWERGSGETLACGTGACAVVVACVLNGKTDHEVTVHLLGGDLLLHYDEQNHTVWMTGPAEIICDGDIPLD